MSWGSGVERDVHPPPGGLATIHSVSIDSTAQSDAEISPGRALGQPVRGFSPTLLTTVEDAHSRDEGSSLESLGGGSRGSHGGGGIAIAHMAGENEAVRRSDAAPASAGEGQEQEESVGFVSIVPISTTKGTPLIAPTPPTLAVGVVSKDPLAVRVVSNPAFVVSNDSAAPEPNAGGDATDAAVGVAHSLTPSSPSPTPITPAGIVESEPPALRTAHPNTRRVRPPSDSPNDVAQTNH